MEKLDGLKQVLILKPESETSLQDDVTTASVHWLIWPNLQVHVCQSSPVVFKKSEDAGDV